MYEVLEEVGAHEKLVLVGHSSSGMHVRLFAQRYPRQVFSARAAPSHASKRVGGGMLTVESNGRSRGSCWWTRPTSNSWGIGGLLVLNPVDQVA